VIDAVVLLGFGGPETPAEIRPFLDRVLEGRRVSAVRYEEVVEHYMHIGGRSPYNELTMRQATALERELRTGGNAIPVRVAFRNTPPYIPDELASLARGGARRVFAIPLTAYGGPASADRYIAAAATALSSLDAALQVEYAAPFFDRPLFIQAQAARIREALARDELLEAKTPALIFTAHSVPLDAATPYMRQLEFAAARTAETLGISSWTLAYQSRSGAPTDAWLEPDVRDVLRSLASRGARHTVVAPIGFLCEHVEVMYDLDVDAAEVARECGITMVRAKALDDHPFFIAMLAGLVECAS
jgi:protoporphyrin/coproporphyrin ferrochelatase